MTRRTVVADSIAYEFSADDPPPLADCLWSLVRGRAVDEITGEPLAQMHASVQEPELTVRTGEGGTYAVIGRPWRRFPPLAAPMYPLHITITADGYLAYTQLVAVSTYQRSIAAPAPAIGATVLTLSSNADLRAGQRLLIGPAGASQESLTIATVGPAAGQVTLAAPLAHAHPIGAAVVADEFAPIDVPDAAMHRLPVIVRGRTVRRNPTGIGTTPVATASLVVQGVWRTAAAVRQHLPAEPPNIVSLAPGLYAERGVGAQLAAQALPAVGGEEKILIRAAPSGDALIEISDRKNLVAPPSPPPASVLRIGADEPPEAEHIMITAIAALGDADEPARTSFAYALNSPHRRGATVERVTPQPPAAPKTLVHAGSPGDTCVFLDDVAGASAAGTAVITGGAAAPEFHYVHAFAAVSDADGYFELPPLSRVAQISLNATAAALTPVTIEFQPDYTQRTNWVDVVFS